MNNTNLKIGRYGLIYTSFLMWLIILAFSWNFEEFNKINTILVVLLVFSLGFLVIRKAEKYHIVRSRTSWMFVFVLKLTISFFITKYLWALPLAPDYLRCDGQHALQDSNIYDLDAKYLVNHGFLSSKGLSEVWLSFGIVRYIAIIYKVFGVSVLYVSMFNALLSLLGFIFLAGILKILDCTNIRKWQAIRYGMFLPIASYYDATPSKEPLTLAAFFMAMFFLAKLLYVKEKRNISLAGLFLASFALAVTRLSVFMMFVAIALASIIILSTMPVSRRLTLAIIVPLLLLIILGSTYNVVVGRKLTLCDFKESFLSVESRLNQAKEQLSKKQLGGDNPLKVKVLEALLPRSIWDFVVFSPARALLWIYSPYPLIIPHVDQFVRLPDLLARSDYREYVRITASLFPQFSSWVIIFLTPAVMSSFLSRKSDYAGRRSFLIIALLTITLLISNVLFLEFTRQRFILEPLILSLALWGYAHGSPHRHYLAVGLIFGSILVLFALWTFLG